jgi:hypothetical protein
VHVSSAVTLTGWSVETDQCTHARTTLHYVLMTEWIESSVFLLSSATCSTHAYTLGERDGSINSPQRVHAMLASCMMMPNPNNVRRLMQICA